MSELLQARLDGGVSQRAVAAPFGRTAMWYSLIERGKIPISRDLETKILTVIARLSAFQDAANKNRAELVEGLDLGTRANRAKRKTPQSRHAAVSL